MAEIKTNQIPTEKVEENIQAGPLNANLNYYQYGDDSHPDQQSQKGGMNPKYTGEGVSNTYIEYNPDLKTADLDPNYLYGENAKVQNSKEAGYIARRNDNIASALYNEGLTSKEDVANFLSQQSEWMNSTEADRLNTIDSVWKRLGEFQKQQEQQQPTQEEKQSSPEFGAKGEAENGGEIFGRASGDKSTTIKTNNDPYSPEAVTLRRRQANYQSLQAMDSYDIALCQTSGMSLYGETAMRDLATYDPQKYQEVQTYIKQIQQGDTVNAIASGEHGTATQQTNNADNVVNNSIVNWTQSNSNERTYDQTQDLLTGKLSNNQVAQTATQEMLNLKRQMAELESELANLPTTVKNQFRGDAPQYIIDAKVANEGQRIQAELSKLQSRYNGAIELYKTELSNAQWEAEMELNERKFAFTQNQQLWENAFNTAQQNRENEFKTRQQGWTEYYQGQQLLLDNDRIKTDKNGLPYIINSDGTYTYLTDTTYENAVKNLKKNAVDTLNSVWFDGMEGGQCEAFTDSFNDTAFGQTMLPVDEDGNVIQGRTWTYAGEKAQYVNSAIPEVGSTAIFVYGDKANVSNAAKQFGHTMVVVGYDPTTQTMTLKGSNGPKGNEQVYTKTMTLDEFRTKYRGAGFWDPTKPTRFQKSDNVVATEYSAKMQKMTKKYEELIENAGTQGTKDLLSTAFTMYETLSELNEDGSLEELINTTDFQKTLKQRAEKSYKTDDGGSEFGQLLRKFMLNKNLSAGAKKALNRLYLLVEMKLRNESGAAISSSEWMNNFKLMIPDTFEDKQQMRDVLQNWDIVIKKYSRGGGMKTEDYIPIFDKNMGERTIFAG